MGRNPKRLVALQQPNPADRRYTKTGWTSETIPIGTKVAYEHPTRPKWLWRIVIGWETQGDTAVALAKLMTRINSGRPGETDDVNKQRRCKWAVAGNKNKACSLGYQGKREKPFT